MYGFLLIQKDFIALRKLCEENIPADLIGLRYYYARTQPITFVACDNKKYRDILEQNFHLSLCAYQFSDQMDILFKRFGNQAYFV